MNLDLTTEARNPDSTDLDSMDSAAMVQLMIREDAGITAAVAAEAGQIAAAIDVIAARMAAGGRLVYAGAGTSGRLGILDAAECPPTFNTRPEQVIGLIAGGSDAMLRAVEGAEDSPAAAIAQLRAIGLGAGDVVVGIAASGRTPYVLGALQYAREQGAAAVAVTCNRNAEVAAVADITIATVVGPEILSGSTRMKAGTATKMVLNMLSTGAMVRLGKTYGNLMVDLQATNAKLVQRSCNILREITGIDEAAARAQLQACAGDLKLAVVCEQLGLAPDAGRARLAAAGGVLRKALAP